MFHLEGGNLQNRTSFVMERLVTAMLNEDTVQVFAFYQEPDERGRVTYSLVLPVAKTSEQLPLQSEAETNAATEKMATFKAPPPSPVGLEPFKELATGCRPTRRESFKPPADCDFGKMIEMLKAAEKQGFRF